MVGDTKIMPPRNGEGTAEVGRPHMDQLIAHQADPRSSSPVAAVCPLSGRVDGRRPAGRGRNRRPRQIARGICRMRPRSPGPA